MSGMKLSNLCFSICLTLSLLECIISILEDYAAHDIHVDFLFFSLVDFFSSAIFVCQFPIAIAVDLDALDENVPSSWYPEGLFCTEINQKCK